MSGDYYYLINAHEKIDIVSKRLIEESKRICEEEGVEFKSDTSNSVEFSNPKMVTSDITIHLIRRY